MIFKGLLVMINKDSPSELWVKAALGEFDDFIDFHDPAYGHIFVRKYRDGQIFELLEAEDGFVEYPLAHKKIPLEQREYEPLEVLIHDDLINRRMKAELVELQAKVI